MPLVPVHAFFPAVFWISLLKLSGDAKRNRQFCPVEQTVSIGYCRFCIGWLSSRSSSLSSSGGTGVVRRRSRPSAALPMAWLSGSPGTCGARKLRSAAAAFGLSAASETGCPPERATASTARSRRRGNTAGVGDGRVRPRPATDVLRLASALSTNAGDTVSVKLCGSVFGHRLGKSSQRLT